MGTMTKNNFAKIVEMMSLKVMIVDDDPIFVMLNKLRIKTSNLAENPTSFTNGKAAFDALINDKEEEDSYLVFLDLNMPIMDGWDLLNAIQNSPIAHKVYVVLVTSSIDVTEKQRAKNYPQVIGFYEKAIDLNTCIEIRANPAISHFYA
jgi:CheY-like chemotaxis protein